MDGILNINKPSGMTSHDAVQKVRRIMKEGRIGHTGTLDPLATGVLVLCVGKATRIARYLVTGEKEYRAVMRLGVITDTLDAAGRVLETRQYAPPGREDIERVMRRLTGVIMQRPPAFSAVKVSGVPSYKLARQGRAAELNPRPVTIHRIEMTAYADPLVSFTVRCSKGVYVRTLCADIGEALGMGAHLAALVRTRSGRFSLEQAVTLDQLEDIASAGRAHQAITPMEEALADLPAVLIGNEEASKVLHGNRVSCPTSLANGSSDVARIHDSAGRLLALARIVAGTLRPELVFACSS
ncbi:MAG TPA: tRNA pseudouridine(55) synthase TruB [Nitrospirota bacterium]|nr:tRNA pseudouridine(55) synthase TruB [Nitrospirota bacterium]